MQTETGFDSKLRDPLSEVTRKKRGALLGLSLLGIAVAKTGLIPSNIIALGITFGKTDQKSILILICFIVIYYLISFIVYSVSDFLVWKLAIVQSIQNARRLNNDYLGSLELSERIKEESCQIDLYEENKLIFTLSTPVSIIRAILEFVLPFCVGFYSIYILIDEVIKKASQITS